MNPPFQDFQLKKERKEQTTSLTLIQPDNNQIYHYKSDNEGIFYKTEE